MDHVGFGAFKTSVGATVSAMLADVPSGARTPVYEAVKVRAVVALTPFPCNATEARLCPAGRDTLAGNLAAFTPPADRANVMPPAGAGWFNVIVPVVVTPGPIMEYGVSVMPVIDKAGPGIIVIVTGTPGKPASVAVMVTATGPATESALTGNVAKVVLAGMVTLAGICTAEGVSVARAIVIPPRKAGLFKVMAPARVCPLEKVLVGDVTGIDRDWMEGEGDGVTEMLALAEIPLEVALSAPVVSTATGSAV